MTTERMDARTDGRPDGRTDCVSGVYDHIVHYHSQFMYIVHVINLSSKNTHQVW